jgi:NADH-quinone oxidoreductase E subunit
MAAVESHVVAPSPGVAQVLVEYPDAGRDALIPILQKVQAAEGFLSQAAMQAIGAHLKLPTSKVYGVATFYNQFRFQPQGRYHCQVCRGTACHVKGSAKVLDALQKQLGVEAGQTTRDGRFSLEVVACIGACGLAPVITMDGAFHASVTPDSVRKILKQYAQREETQQEKD